MKVAVIGLGILGESICKYLFERNIEVLAIDNNMNKINEAGQYSTNAIKFDATDRNALQKFKVFEYDIVFVTFGAHFENNVLTTAELKELGTKKIISRATDEIKRKILLKAGASEVYNPEKQFGNMIANKILQIRAIDVIQLNHEYSITEIMTPKIFINKTIRELNIRKNYNINVVTIRKSNNDIDHKNINIDDFDDISFPSPDTILTGNEILVIIGSNNDINKFFKLSDK